MLSLGIYIIGSLLVIVIKHYLRYPKNNGKLPPGSMGWPLLGETIQFFAPNTSFDIPPFVKERMQRQNVGSLHGFMYKYLKNMVLNLFGPESLKNMLPEVEKIVNNNLKRWSGQTSVEMKEASAKMIFDITGKKLISFDSENSTENVSENFVAFIKGLISFPLYFPGTAYYKCLQGRKKILKMLKRMLEERKSQPRKEQSDFFDYVLEELQSKDTILTEAIALDLMFLSLFASFETTSLAITLAIKFLHEYPKALKELTISETHLLHQLNNIYIYFQKKGHLEEHVAIIRRRENASYGLTWKEYKSMKFTFQFINETVRLANIAPVIFRKALKDINFKEYTIPAGWAVMVSPPAVHLNPAKYEDPLQFNPWRWEGIEINGASRNFMAFGGGMRFCVGTDFTKVQMAVFLHCFVTKYKWETIKGGDIVRTPGLQFPNGYHIKISQKEY
ncbi:hypothetical protein MTR67_033954 [Solanum verrucosum]|uniref:Cytochrome P450 n=1 Tax=Solanum verrucosum TaxID=315347 RepID=A0AAF0U7H8_SOLVR|nr:hypothetical protein MTR67_033954 [Solanum verrucosum]